MITPESNAHEQIDTLITSNEHVTLLDNILKAKNVGPRNFPVITNFGYEMQTDNIPHPQDAKTWLARVIQEFVTPEGKRFYPGESYSRDEQMAYNRAKQDAAIRMQESPGDSLSTDLVNKLSSHGNLFQQ